jgi:hypothetical protein
MSFFEGVNDETSFTASCIKTNSYTAREQILFSVLARGIVLHKYKYTVSG